MRSTFAIRMERYHRATIARNWPQRRTTASIITRDRNRSGVGKWESPGITLGTLKRLMANPRHWERIMDQVADCARLDTGDVANPTTWNADEWFVIACCL